VLLVSIVALFSRPCRRCRARRRPTDAADRQPACIECIDLESTNQIEIDIAVNRDVHRGC
jgi:hypothetical protein